MKQMGAAESSSGPIGPVARDSLTRIVYTNLRLALMEGRFRPGHRFKIRELAASMQVSETPIREALMQLVRARALELHDGRSIAVAHLTVGQYTELRTIRHYLEGYAAEIATSHISEAGIARLATLHEELVQAEAERRWSDAVRVNWRFHRGLYEAAELPELLAILDDIWVRNGPLLNLLYPHAPPSYPGRHRHLDVVEHLRARRPEQVRLAIQDDITYGGAGLLALLGRAGDTQALVTASGAETPSP